MNKKISKAYLLRFLVIFLVFTFAFPRVSFSQELSKKELRKKFNLHVRQGKLHFKKREYEKAISEWEKAQALRPKKTFVKKLIKKATRMIEKTSKPKKSLLSYLPFMGGSAKRKKEKVRAKGKLTLDECKLIAMENHLPLKIAKKQLKLAEFRLIEAIRKLGPTVTFKLERSNGAVSGRAYDGGKIAFEGKQPVFYGGEYVYSVRQAKTNLEIVKKEYNRIKNELILQVEKAYYSLDKAKKAFKIQQKLQKRTRELYDIAKTGYDAGVVSQVEFLKVSSQYNQVNFQVVSADEDIAVATLILAQAMNIDEDIDIAGIKEEPKAIEIDLDHCFNLAYANRPELAISKLSLEYFRLEKRIMKARTDWPRVDILGMYGQAREDYISRDQSPGINPRDYGAEFYYGVKVSMPFLGSTVSYSHMEEEWQPVVQTVKGTASQTDSLTVDLFNKLDDISSFKEADLEYLRAEDDLNKKKQEIALEIKETYFKYRKALVLMNVAKSKIDFQSKQVEVLDIRRQLGEAQFSDVVEEMIKLAEEEFSFIQAVADYYIAISTLNKAIGINGYFEVQIK